VEEERARRETGGGRRMGKVTGGKKTYGKKIKPKGYWTA